MPAVSCTADASWAWAAMAGSRVLISFPGVPASLALPGPTAVLHALVWAKP
jgi:hypothetical protein